MCGWRYHDVQALRKTINGVLEPGKAYKAYHFLDTKSAHPERCTLFAVFVPVGSTGRKSPCTKGLRCEETLCSWRCVGMIVVTHVLVNDPTRGYGVFIDNMLDAA